MALLPLASGNAVSNFWDYFLHVFVPEILKAHFMAVLGVSNDLWFDMIDKEPMT